MVPTIASNCEKKYCSHTLVPYFQIISFQGKFLINCIYSMDPYFQKRKKHLIGRLLKFSFQIKFLINCIYNSVPHILTIYTLPFGNYEKRKKMKPSKEKNLY
ncbi:hypothetical protein V6Z12_D11G348200 [Gossypium hirsutum]